MSVGVEVENETISHQNHTAIIYDIVLRKRTNSGYCQ